MTTEINELLNRLEELRGFDETSELAEEIDNIAGRLEDLGYTNY